MSVKSENPAIKLPAPEALWDYFTQLCAIPHGSGNTQALSDWLMDFARRQGLSAMQDENGSVVIRKPAAPGYERSPVTILQGHIDMVCEKSVDSPVDFTRDGLRLCWGEQELRAEGTTLGADNGIAVAMMLVILSRDYPAPALECVFTSDEEIGLLGAVGMDISGLQGRRMINLDSEDEGVLTVGCCGGLRVDCRLPVRRESMLLLPYTVAISGLLGGHSGVEAHLGRANANVLMGRVLKALCESAEARLLTATGGSKDNVIPNRATYTIGIPHHKQQEADELLSFSLATFKKELVQTDPGVRLDVLVGEPAWREALWAEDSRRVAQFLTSAPDGVRQWDARIPSLVQTSLNMGVVTLAHDCFRADFGLRSSVTEEKYRLEQQLRSLSEELGGTAGSRGDYPAWEYREQSPLRELAVEVFIRQYGHPPKLEIIHAGLECGVFSHRLPNLDCISLGPDLRHVHTVRESVDIASTKRVWCYLLELLRQSV